MTGRATGGVWAVAGIALFAVSLLFAQTPRKPAADKKNTKQEPVPLRVTSRLVQVNVSVTDSRGAFVPGLRKEDFTITDGGEEQAVSFFAVAEKTTEHPQPANERAKSFSNRIPLSVATVAPVSYVILFDGLNTQVTDQAYARENIVRFLRSVRQGELVAVYVLGNGLKVAHDFTGDIAELQRTAEKLSAVTSRFDTTAPDIAGSGVAIFDEFASINEKRIEAQFIQNRVRTTLRAIEAIARHLQGVPGRKNLLWVSASFPLGVGLQNPDETYARLDLLRSFSEDLLRAMGAVNDANVAIYPIDSRGLVAPIDDRARLTKEQGDSGPLAQIQRGAGGRTGGSASGSGGSSSGGQGGASSGGSGGKMLSDSLPPRPQIPNPFEIREADNTRMTMREIADLTGGRAFYNTNDLSGALRDAMNDSQLTYVLGYYPAHNKWDGQFREIKVRANRFGVQIRNRRGYFAAPEPSLEDDAQKTAMEEAAAAPLAASGLGLTMSFDASSPADAYLMRLRVEPKDVSLVRKENVFNGALEVLVETADASGVSIWKDAQRTTLRLKPETYDRISRDGLQFRMRIPKADGVSEIRAAVRDPSTGAYGTLRVPIAAIVNSASQ